MPSKRQKRCEVVCCHPDDNEDNEADDSCRTVGQAAREGRIDELLRLLENEQYMISNICVEGYPADSPNTDGWMPLHEAVKNNCVEAVEILLGREEVDVNYKSYSGDAAIHLSIRNSDTRSLKLLLDHGADPDIKNSDEITALHIAASTCMDAVKLLIDSGADINALSCWNGTPLHEAVESENIDIVRELLRSGVTLNKTNEHGMTALFKAAEMGNEECLMEILEHCKRTGDMDVINQVTNDNATPLFMAAQKKLSRCVKALLDSGADPNICVHILEEQSPLPLHVAIQMADIECVRLLVPVTCKETLRQSGLSPMSYLLSEHWGYPEELGREMVRCLLEGGIDVNDMYSCDDDYYYFQFKTFVSFRGLLRYGDRKTELCRLALCSPEVKLDYVRDLLDAGARIDPISSKELPTLIAALGTVTSSVCLPQLLVERGACVNLYHECFVGNMAVIVSLAKWSALEFILRAGAEVDSLLRCPVSRSSRVEAPRLIHYSSLDIMSADDGYDDYEQDYDVPPRRISLWQILTASRYYLLLEKISMKQVLQKLLEFSGTVRLGDQLLALVESEEDRKEIRNITDSPRTLMHLSRLAIRRRFSPAQLISPSLQKSLPLPQILIDYVSYTIS